MSRAFEYYQHTQLNPEDVIRRGNAKRYQPTTMADKNNEIAAMISEMGEDEYRRKCQEDAELITRKKQ